MRKLSAQTPTRRAVLALSVFIQLLASSDSHANGGYGRSLGSRFFQMTGTDVRVGQTNETNPFPELADAAPPRITSKGEIEIYGSAPYYIRYSNWAEFDRGGTFEIIPLDLRYPNGHWIGVNHTHPWDLRRYTVVQGMERLSALFDFMVGSTMTPTQGRLDARYDTDSANRRIFQFHEQGATWVRDQTPIFGTVKSGWPEHSYGGNFFQEGHLDQNLLDLNSSHPIYFFYERVSDARHNSPYVTELFGREVSPEEISSPESNPPLQSPEHLALSTGNPPLDATRRTIGGYLIEGPRPIQITVQAQKFYLITFSAGDYPTDGYTMSYAWSRNPLGPYHPALARPETGGRMDLLDLGQRFKKNNGLSFVGRPVLYPTPNHGYQMLFHGVEKYIHPDNDYKQWPKKYTVDDFYRCLFKVDVNFFLSDAGEPVLNMNP